MLLNELESLLGLVKEPVAEATMSTRISNSSSGFHPKRHNKFSHL